MKKKDFNRARDAVFRILQERDMPAYPDSARDAGVEYTDYLTGAGAHAKGFNFATDPKTGKNYVYTPERNRQCSIGYHEECTDPSGETCGCPCHQLVALLQAVASGGPIPGAEDE